VFPISEAAKAIYQYPGVGASDPPSFPVIPSQFRFALVPTLHIVSFSLFVLCADSTSSFTRLQ
jgi:hypothetical protein